MVNSSAAAQSCPTPKSPRPKPAGRSCLCAGRGRAAGAPELPCPLRPALSARHRPLRRSQHAAPGAPGSRSAEAAARRILRRMSLLVVPCLDRGIEAVFRQCVVPAFQHIGRRSQRCDGVPLEIRVRWWRKSSGRPACRSSRPSLRSDRASGHRCGRRSSTRRRPGACTGADRVRECRGSSGRCCGTAPG